MEFERIDDDKDDFDELDGMKIDQKNDPRNTLKNFEENNRSLSTRMIASSLIPKVADVYIKFERILDEFNSIIYYNCIIEILAWFVGLLLFFSYPSQLAFIWMHLLHLPRGGFGLYLVIKITPKSYNLIDSISDFNKDQLNEHWGFEEMAKHIRDNFKKQLVNILSESRKLYIIYFVLTWINATIDMIDFLVQLIRFGTDGKEYSVLAMLAIVIVFLFTILSYLFWVLTFFFRVEPKYRRDAIKAALGVMEGLRSKITDSIHKYKNQMFVKNEPPKRPSGNLRNTNLHAEEK